MREFYGCLYVRDLIPRQARERPDAIALMHRDRATSYGELDERTKRIAQGLIAMGLRPQDRIAYLGNNSDLYFELLLGAAAANVVLAPINWRLAAPEIASVLQDVEAKILFVGRGFSDVATALNVPGLDRVVSMGAGASGLVIPRNGETRSLQMTPKLRWIPRYCPATLHLRNDRTTQRRGVVQHQHSDVPELLCDPRCATRLTGDDVAVVCLPMFHIAGTGFGLCALDKVPARLCSKRSV